MPVMSRAASASGTLTGSEKVAVLLLALGKARSAKLLAKFDAEELKRLTRSAADLRPVRMSDLETLVEEFAQTFSNGVGFAGTVSEVKNLLSGVMTEEQFAAVMADAPVREEPVWERIADLSAGDPSQLSRQGASANRGVHPVPDRFGTRSKGHRHVRRRSPQQPAVPDDRPSRDSEMMR